MQLAIPPVEICHRFIDRAADIGHVMAFADRGDVIQLVDAGFEGVLGALQIGSQRRYAGAVDGQCGGDDFLIVGELRQ